MSGKQFKPDLDTIIEKGLLKYKENSGLSVVWNQGEIKENLEREWLGLYQKYLKENHSPEAAANFANQELQYNMGLRPGANGFTLILEYPRFTST